MNEHELILAALQVPGTGRNRTAFLERACAGDRILLKRVDRRLRAALSENATKTLPPSTPADLGTGSRNDAAGADDVADTAQVLALLAPPGRPDSLGRLDHYEILKVIGRGGMGVVLLGFDEKLSRTVAIKVLAPQVAASATARHRFAREARAAAAIRDPHVVAIYDVCETPVPHLVMDYVAGQTLQDRLARDGPLSVATVLDVGIAIARGLAAAHAVGLVHHDVKPGNVLLENGIERARLGDFGLARAIDDAGITQTGTLAGTPLYMSPERPRGARSITAATCLALAASSMPPAPPSLAFVPPTRWPCSTAWSRTRRERSARSTRRSRAAWKRSLPV